MGNLHSIKNDKNETGGGRHNTHFLSLNVKKTIYINK